MRRAWPALIIAAVAAVAAVPAVASDAGDAGQSKRRAATPLIVRTGVSQAGGREVKSIGRMRDRRWRLSSFRAAFGRPSTCASRTPDVAIAEWRSVGVKASFYTLGLGADGCVGAHLYAGTVTLRGARWQTDAGLRIGDSVARIAVLYPGAVRRGVRWTLERRTSQFGAAGDFPSLVATSRAGVVRAFVADIGAGGE